MLHVGMDGYWRDTISSGSHKRTATFGHKDKVTKAKATIAWREWVRCHGELPKKRRGLPCLSNIAQEFLNYSAEYYRHPDHTQTGEADNLKYGLQPLIDIFPRLPIDEFTNDNLDMYVEDQIARKVSRSTINKRIGHIKRMFKWAKNKIGCPVFDRIRDYNGLQLGRSQAPESEKIEPISMDVVNKTMAQLPAVLADMVTLQLLTAMRPAEVCQMSGKMINREKLPWIYEPQRHKNRWRNMDRKISLGPKAREIVKKYLAFRPFAKNLFSPDPKQQARKCDGYNTRTYAHAIWRACDRAFEPPPELLEQGKEEQLRKWQLKQRWSPNRLRHTRLTELDQLEGADASRAIAGHTMIETTKGNYIKRDDELAGKLMEKYG